MPVRDRAGRDRLDFVVGGQGELIEVRCRRGLRRAEVERQRRHKAGLGLNAPDLIWQQRPDDEVRALDLRGQKALDAAPLRGVVDPDRRVVGKQTRSQGARQRSRL